MIAPRRTVALLAAGEARPSDVAWLLALRLVAGELDRFVRAVAIGGALGVGAGAQEFLGVASAIVPDVVGILAAGMMLQLFVRAKNAFDVAAYAWIPYLAVTTASALYFTARGYPPSGRASRVVECAGVAWAIGVWIVALVETRQLPAEAGK